jgi:hypothetical protein
MIAEAMARAEKVACRRGEGRYYAFPDSVEDAGASCTQNGRCRIGWIISDAGRESWDMWLEVHTGEERLRPACLTATRAGLRWTRRSLATPDA